MPADLAQASRAWMSDRPSWCVDHGVTLEAMATCDLWLALARGDVTPETKVWREGMPYWDHIANVPEFALALPDSSVWEPAPRSGARRVGAAPGAEAGGEDAADRAARGAAARLEYGRIQAENGPISDVRAAGSAAGSAASESADRMAEVMANESETMGPACELVTPAPVVVEEKETVRPPSRTRRRALPKIDRASALSVAIGATLAVLALMLATTLPAPGAGSSGGQDRAPQAAAQHVAAGAPVRGVELPMPVRATAEQSAPASPTSPTSTPSVNDSKSAPDTRTRGPRPLDRGQKRARTGTGDRRQ